MRWLRSEHALAQGEGDSQVLGHAGCALADIGQHERGAAILRQALDIDPSNAQAHVALGAAQGLLGQWDAAVANMRHGMRISPRDRRLGFWAWVLGRFLLRAGRPDEALAEARASAGRDARLHLSRILMAAALQALGRADEACEALAAARRLRPRLTLAEIELSHGRRVAQGLAAAWAAGDALRGWT
jgi:tetratricopeptide (TPR) repeat protein